MDPLPTLLLLAIGFAAGVVACHVAGRPMLQARPPLPVWEPPKGDQFMAVLRVIDGDTLAAGLVVPTTIRVNGIDAPELSTIEGKVSAAYANSLMVTPTILRCLIHGRDKYGRAVADVLLSDGRSLADAMLAAGKAKPWDGHGPHPK